MGLSLHQNSLVASEFFSTAERVVGGGFLDVLFHGPGELLTEAKFCQLALFVHGCAAAAMLKDGPLAGQCTVSYGLSLGELTALWAAGVFDFETGLKIVAERGRLMQKACEETDGSMLCLIGGEWGYIDALCQETGVVAANVNCPGQVVVSGETCGIERAMEIAERMPFKRVVRLNVAGAYHSKLMEDAGNAFGKFLQTIDFSPPKLRVLTNVTGEELTSPLEVKEMLARQIFSPVLFERCCRRAIQLGVTEHLECGPGKTLSAMAKRIDKTTSTRNFDKFDDFQFINTASCVAI
jgi:[acyl-carrier-protein] S-malonyltransferase